jgi:L-fucose mutarotase
LLRNIDARVIPELLYALACMGHGDEIAIVDTNFPARSVSRPDAVIELPGVNAPDAAALILGLMPLDTFVDDPCLRMEVVDDPQRLEPVQHEVQRAIDTHGDCKAQLRGVERFEFYARAAKAYIVVRTGERRFYGCFLFKCGVLPPG